MTSQTGSEVLQARTRQPHRVVVERVESMTPHMRRIAFCGNAFADMQVPLPAQWLKVIVPASGEERGANRAYTIRRIHRGERRMEIDFVLHDHAGPVSTWARNAAVGDVVHVGDPRGGHRIDPDARWRLLAGDETALPAIASILEALPQDRAPTCVVIEVPSMDDVQRLRASKKSDVHWLPRGDALAIQGHLLQDRISQLALSEEFGQVFLAGEATAVRAIKQDLVLRCPLARIDAKGYWMLGQKDHRDRA